MVFFRGGPFLPSGRSYEQPSFLHFTKRKDLVKLEKGITISIYQLKQGMTYVPSE